MGNQGPRNVPCPSRVRLTGEEALSRLKANSAPDGEALSDAVYEVAYSSAYRFLSDSVRFDRDLLRRSQDQGYLPLVEALMKCDYDVQWIEDDETGETAKIFVLNIIRYHARMPRPRKLRFFLVSSILLLPHPLILVLTNLTLRFLKKNPPP